MESSSDRPGGEPRRPATRAPLRRRLALAFATVLILVLALEGAARLSDAGRAPVLRGSGTYLNALPLVTSVGGHPIDLYDLPEGERLPREKRPGEVRVAVFGESSIEGAPFGAEVSPPALIRDLLARELPDTDLTVINMGRSGSILANVYYYLVYIKDYAPDFIVFYMGMNDGIRQSGEACTLATRPVLHRAWRFAVEHSRLLWWLRVFGVQHWWAWSHKSDWHAPKDCAVDAFQAWADLLVETARETGARVIVANPVASVVKLVEQMHEGEYASASDVPPLSDEYRAVLACALTDGCDLAPRVRPLFLASPRLETWNTYVGRIWTGWKTAAERGGAEHIEFNRLLEAASPHGMLVSEFFSDWMRLSLRGYLYLSRLVTARIVAAVRGVPPADVPVPDVEDVRPFLARAKSGMPNVFEQFRRGLYLSVVPNLLFTNRYLRGVPTDDPCKAQELDLAEIALGWLRMKAGLDSGLPPEKQALALAFDPFQFAVGPGTGPRTAPGQCKIMKPGPM